MKQKTLIILGVGVLGYILWKKSQQETTSEFANIGGGRRRRNKVDKWENKLCKMCVRTSCGNSSGQQVSCAGKCGCPPLGGL